MLKRIFYVCVLLVFTISLQAENNQESVEKKDNIFSIENFLNWNSTNYEQSLYNCTQAELACRIGLYYTGQGDVEKAIEYYNVALMFDPEDLLLHSIYFNLGMLYNSQENLAKAMEYLNLALKVSPENDIDLFYIYFTLGKINIFQENYDKAIESFNSALNLNLQKEFPEFNLSIANIYYDLGFIYGEKEDLKKATVCTQKAIDFDSNYSEAYGGLSFYLILKKQFKEAEKMARKGLLLDESQKWIYSNLSISLLFQGKYDEAVLYINEFADIEGEKEMMMEDLDLYENAGIIPKKRNTDVEKFKKILKNDK
jgi:tetratricopeptide (TPR) repeat protein